MPSYDDRLKSSKRKTLSRIIRERGDPCGFCGQAIDYGTKVGPWRFVVDEVIPRYLGGDPLDITNCRAAHHYCNSVSGGRIGGKLRSAKAKRPDTASKW